MSMPFSDKVAQALNKLEMLFSLRTNIVFLSLKEAFLSVFFQRLAPLHGAKDGPGSDDCNSLNLSLK